MKDAGTLKDLSTPCAKLSLSRLGLFKEVRITLYFSLPIEWPIPNAFQSNCHQTIAYLMSTCELRGTPLLKITGKLFKVLLVKQNSQIRLGRVSENFNFKFWAEFLQNSSYNFGKTSFARELIFLSIELIGDRKF